MHPTLLERQRSRDIRDLVLLVRVIAIVIHYFLGWAIHAPHVLEFFWNVDKFHYGIHDSVNMTFSTSDMRGSVAKFFDTFLDRLDNVKWYPAPSTIG